MNGKKVMIYANVAIVIIIMHIFLRLDPTIIVDKTAGDTGKNTIPKDYQKQLEQTSGPDIILQSTLAGSTGGVGTVPKDYENNLLAERKYN